MQHQFRCDDVPDCQLTLGAETEIRLLEHNGFSVMVDESEDGTRAWCVVEIPDGTRCVLEIPESLYVPLVHAGAVAGQCYLIVRNAQAAKNVFKVKATEPF